MPTHGGRDGLYVYLKDPTGGKGKVRSAETGRFIERNAADITATFDSLAQRAQANVVRLIQDRLIRETVSTGRLVRVTARPENRYADQFGFGVGVIEYLDRSEALYWRSQEEGSKIAWADTPGGRSSMIGMQIRGKFGGSIVGWRDSSWGMRPVAGPEWNAPEGAFNALRKLPEVTIQKDIRPMHAYADVYDGSDIFKNRAPAYIRGLLRKAIEQELKPFEPGY